MGRGENLPRFNRVSIDQTRSMAGPLERRVQFGTCGRLDFYWKVMDSMRSWSLGMKVFKRAINSGHRPVVKLGNSIR